MLKDQYVTHQFNALPTEAQLLWAACVFWSM